MRNAKIAIYTVTKDRLEYTKRTIDSLENHTYIPYDHYIVDNGSIDGSVEYLKTMPGRVVKVIFNSDNRGLMIAANQALDEIGDRYDYIVKIDNDCDIVSDNWLEPIVEIINHMNGKIVLSPFVSGLGGRFPDGFPRYDYINVNGHRLGLTRHLGGITVVAPAWVYRSYRFPTNAPLHGGSDVRFSAYIQIKLGLQIGYVEDVVVMHMDGTQNQHIKFPEYHELRSHEKYAVYNEHPLVTKMLRPVRRVSFIRSIRKAGINNKTVYSCAMDKIKRALGGSN